MSAVRKVPGRMVNGKQKRGDPQAARTCKASPFAMGGLCAYWPVKFEAMKLPAGVKNM